jgi:hypothetical protein
MSLLCENEFTPVRFAKRFLSRGEIISESETTLATDALLTDLYGPMNPSCLTSQKEFNLAFVVISDREFASEALMSGIEALAKYHEGNSAGYLISGDFLHTTVVSGSLGWATDNRATFSNILPPRN